MTEAEWTTTINAERLVAALPFETSNRKLRLFGVACCRRMWATFNDLRSMEAVDMVERYAEGAATEEELRVAEIGAEDSFRDYQQNADADGRDWDQDPMVHAASAVWTLTASPSEIATAAHTLGEYVMGVATQTAAASTSYSDESLAQSYLLREIFGNPFLPVTFSPEWRTDTAVALASQMYASREFSAMPILADALQDAGCENETVLNHCRDANAMHVRGCWVVDLVLGKQ